MTTKIIFERGKEREVILEVGTDHAVHSTYVDERRMTTKDGKRLAITDTSEDAVISEIGRIDESRNRHIKDIVIKGREIGLPSIKSITHRTSSKEVL